MKLKFIGAAHEVTGSCTLLEACGKHILIDCGMEQAGDTCENCAMPVHAGEIDAILLTHAHIDHSDLVPKLVKEGFEGRSLLIKILADVSWYKKYSYDISLP